MNKKPKGMILNYCPNDECKSIINYYRDIIDRNEQHCTNCGSMLIEAKIENDPFHFQYTQVEKHYEERDDFMSQIQKYEKIITPMFEWLTQEDLNSIQKTCVNLLYKHGLQKKKNQVKFLVSAILFDLIRRKNNIQQADDIRKMMKQLDVKSKDLLFYLQFVDSAQISIKEAFQEQLRNFEEEIRRYLLSNGSAILFQIKHQTKSSSKYSEIISILLESLRKLLENLYALDVVLQFCESKKPSRWVISLGYTALQILQIYIMPIEYSKMFNINLSTLKFFTFGLRSVLINEITRFKELSKESTSLSVEGNQKTIKNLIDNGDSLNESFSDISYKPRKKLKSDKFDISQSTFDFSEEFLGVKERAPSNHATIQHYIVIARFFEKDFQNYTNLQENFKNEISDKQQKGQDYELQDIEKDILELQDLLKL